VHGCVNLYGVGVRFNRPLGGLRGLPSCDRAEVSIHIGDLPRELADERLPARDRYVGEAQSPDAAPSVRFAEALDRAFYRFSYADGTRIVVDRAGDNVWATVPEGATVEDTGTYLLGPTMGFVLRLRGLVCLHASAVEIGGAAVAFAGEAGAGKSSLAAAFAQRGHRVLTDDVGALRLLDGRVHVAPAYPRVRLWPDSADALFGSRDALPRITPSWDKRYLDLNDGARRFADEPLALAAIYVLRRGRRDLSPSIQALDPRTALIELVPQMYSTRLLDGPMRAREFEFLSILVAAVPVLRLTCPEAFGRIHEVCDAVLRDRG